MSRGGSSSYRSGQIQLTTSLAAAAAWGACEGCGSPHLLDTCCSRATGRHDLGAAALQVRESSLHAFTHTLER